MIFHDFKIENYFFAFFLNTVIWSAQQYSAIEKPFFGVPLKHCYMYTVVWSEFRHFFRPLPPAPKHARPPPQTTNDLWNFCLFKNRKENSPRQINGKREGAFFRAFLASPFLPVEKSHNGQTRQG